MLNILDLENKPLAELRSMAASEFGIQNAHRLKKEALVIRLRQAEAAREGLEVRGGILEIMSEGIGFLRSEHYQVSEDDVYVSQAQLRRYDLRDGDMIVGHVRPPRDSERHYGLLKVESVNGVDPEEARFRPKFENLTPIFPDVRFDLETRPDVLSTRMINLIALERAKRLVEIGRHVVILMDSITRLARAYNLTVNPSGRTLSGGIDPSALYPPKHFFGAARNLEEGGSLTIVATCLVDTGSRLDDVVFEEFKGTGNMEMHLSRRLQERRIFPAVDIERSSTRREELLLGPDLLQRVWLMRRMYTQMTSNPPAGAGMDQTVATEAIIQRMVKSKNNMDFLEKLTDNL